MHGWMFDLWTGQAMVEGGRLKRHAVKVVGNDVLVEDLNPDPNRASK
jgi:nitrite reductase/ring-hydroxylating ferredoxin subunit